MEPVLDELRDDLTDGQDLALAAQLVGDVLARRARRARETLGRLSELVDEQAGAFGLTSDELEARVRTLTDRTGDFEREMRRLATRLKEAAEDYEDELVGLFDDLDDQ